MAFIEWKEEYSVKNPQIDQQHKRLIDLINQLHEAMKAGGNPLKVSKIVDDLVSYTHFHFTYEERMMADTGYPAVASHREIHKGMAHQVEWFHKEITSGRASLPLSLMSFLKNWLSKHILESDMDYSRHISQRKVTTGNRVLLPQNR